MEDNYNFLADLLDTYQSMSGGMQLVWTLLLPCFILGLTALILNHRAKLKQSKYDVPDHLSYSIHHINDEQTIAYRYDQYGKRHRYRDEGHHISNTDADMLDDEILALEQEFETAISPPKNE